MESCSNRSKLGKRRYLRDSNPAIPRQSIKKWQEKEVLPYSTDSADRTVQRCLHQRSSSPTNPTNSTYVDDTPLQGHIASITSTRSSDVRIDSDRSAGSSNTNIVEDLDELDQLDNVADSSR